MKKHTVLRTRGNALFQHQPCTVFVDGQAKGAEPVTEKFEHGNRYYQGWVGPVGDCFLQWVRADNLREVRT